MLAAINVRNFLSAMLSLGTR
eukprot:SAG31_NODE_18788_length_622_cov_1.665392_2_plen_20_part_01